MSNQPKKWKATCFDPLCELHNPKPDMSDNPTTGEGTVVQEARIRIVNYLGDRVNRPFARYEEDEIESIINAALAAERERYKLALSDSQRRGELLDSSQKQLATAVEALKEIGANKVRQGEAIWMRDIADAALAKIGV